MHLTVTSSKQTSKQANKQASKQAIIFGHAAGFVWVLNRSQAHCPRTVSSRTSEEEFLGAGVKTAFFASWFVRTFFPNRAWVRTLILKKNQNNLQNGPNGCRVAQLIPKKAYHPKDLRSRHVDPLPTTPPTAPIVHFHEDLCSKVTSADDGRP